jgi:glycosyltransferase involved in cell wall biosynthesis
MAAESNTNRYLVRNPDHSKFTGSNIDPDNLPMVSFCIPTKNNDDTLEACLRSVRAQNYPHFEVIIIDGHSTDGTLEIANRYADTVLFDSGTYGSACQTGIDHSTGAIIALIDSDIEIPHDDWLRNAVAFFNYDDRVSSVWPLYVAPPNSPKFEHLYQTSLYRVLIEDRIEKNRSVFGGGNTLFLRKYLEEIGGVDRSIHWGADFDWAMKLKDRGYLVVFINDPLYHDTMRTVGQFYRKQFVGAKTFTQAGFGMMGLSARQVLYEHYVLGIKEMFKGLFIYGDSSWLYYPVLLGIRTLSYSYIYLSRIADSVRGKTNVT